MRLDDSQLADLKSRRELSKVLADCGIRLRGAGPVKWACCPFHSERTASFKVDDRRGFYHCFGCGAHGDHIEAVMELKGCSFREAVAFLGGARELSHADRRAIDEAGRKSEDEDARAKAHARSSVRRQFEAAQPIAGTHAEDYLRRRGIATGPRMWADLRFAPRLAYRGFRDEGDREGAVLDEVPAMLAAIRDASGEIIGLHRTYLDPIEPAKFAPPGDKARNKPKKVLGEARGGMIRLSPMGTTLILGEGIETALSGYQLGLAGADAAVAAAVSLGNLSGGAEGMVPHPEFPDEKRRQIPNGIPDHDRPGVILPDEVETVILLMDGDSEPCMSMARIRVAARRFRDLERRVLVHAGPAGLDHNDLLVQRLRSRLAA